jgi:hypothetical protein
MTVDSIDGFNCASEPVGVTKVRRLKHRQVIAVAIGGLIALKLAILFVLAWNSRFVMDEFVQFGWAKYLSNGLFESIWPTKAVGYAIFFSLAHVVGWDARSMLLAGRMETALLALGTLAVVYVSARAIGESKTRSGLVVLILLCFSNFIERIFETRAEPVAVFFGAAALLVALCRRDRRLWILVAGALSGLAFLSTQKAVYFNVALGLALIGDAALERRYTLGIARGFWLVLGWLVPVIVYCLAFGKDHPLAVAQTVFFGPVDALSPQIAAGYGGLRHFVVQTLVRNALLYPFCFGGMILSLVQIRRLDTRSRLALIFSVIVTALVFAHDQPWPYVFVMALPFMALWSLKPFDALADYDAMRFAVAGLLGVAIAASFVGNLLYLRRDNHDQLEIVARTESLLGPNDVYFDAIGMLPNRREPSTLWLDRQAVQTTLREGRKSAAYKVFAESPPKLVIWSYRMDAIEPVVAPLIRNSYVQVAPNVRMAGRKLHLGAATQFKVPISGLYALYSVTGRQVFGRIEVDGQSRGFPVRLEKGSNSIRLVEGPTEALLLPDGDYGGKIGPSSDDRSLFNGVYD